MTTSELTLVNAVAGGSPVAFNPVLRNYMQTMVAEFVKAGWVRDTSRPFRTQDAFTEATYEAPGTATNVVPSGNTLDGNIGNVFFRKQDVGLPTLYLRLRFGHRYYSSGSDQDRRWGAFTLLGFSNSVWDANGGFPSSGLLGWSPFYNTPYPSSGVFNTAPQPYYLTGGPHRFAMVAMAGLANVDGRVAVSLDRTRLPDGTPTADGWTFSFAGMNSPTSAPDDIKHQSSYLPAGVGLAAVNRAASGWAAMSPHVSTGLAGGDYHYGQLLVATPAIRTARAHLGVYKADVADRSVFAVEGLGTYRAFYDISNFDLGYQANTCIAVQWE